MLKVTIESGNMFPPEEFVRDHFYVGWENLSWSEKEELISTLKFNYETLKERFVTECKVLKANKL